MNVKQSTSLQSQDIVFFISCINIQLSIEESFLLQMNVGGGLGKKKIQVAYDSEVVGCKLMRNMCCSENVVIASMEKIQSKICPHL